MPAHQIDTLNLGLAEEEGEAVDRQMTVEVAEEREAR